MKKIKSLFERDYQGTGQVYDKVVPGSEWVQNGEGVATQKFDGTACMVKDGYLYKRYDAKNGKQPPKVGIPCEPERNEHTGHWPWWVPVGDGPEDKYFREAFRTSHFTDGTYELIGPKINGNKEKVTLHSLTEHGRIIYSDVPTDFEGVKAWLSKHEIEGIVWHHPDGRMVKIKRTDFGLKW